MSDTSRKRSRKSKLVPRKYTAESDDEDLHSQKISRIEIHYPKKEEDRIIEEGFDVLIRLMKSVNETTQTTSQTPMSFDIQVEVEKCDDYCIQTGEDETVAIKAEETVANKAEETVAIKAEETSKIMETLVVQSVNAMNPEKKTLDTKFEPVILNESKILEASDQVEKCDDYCIQTCEDETVAIKAEETDANKAEETSKIMETPVVQSVYLMRYNAAKEMNPEKKTLNTTFEPIILNESKILEASDQIIANSDNIADKILDIGLRNTIGHGVKGNHYENMHDHDIQEVLDEWRNWQIRSFHRLSPLFYKCYVCEKSWWYLSDFRDHITQHAGINIALEMYERHEVNVIAYQITKPAVRDFYTEGLCKHCGQDFDAHKLSSRIKQKFYANKGCTKQFFNCLSLKDHNLECSICQTEETNFKCEICKSSYDTQEVLNKHLEVSHTVRSDVPITTQYKVCKDCRARYSCSYLHICGTKSPHFRCHRCFRSFPHKILIELHYMESSSESYTCQICGQTLNWSCKIYEHMMKHTKKYMLVRKCVKCDVLTVFANNDAAAHHRYREHVDSKSTKEMCYFSKIIVPKSGIEQAALVESEECDKQPIKPVDVPISDKKSTKRILTKVNMEESVPVSEQESAPVSEQKSAPIIVPKCFIEQSALGEWHNKSIIKRVYVPVFEQKFVPVNKEKPVPVREQESVPIIVPKSCIEQAALGESEEWHKKPIKHVYVPVSEQALVPVSEQGSVPVSEQESAPVIVPKSCIEQAELGESEEWHKKPMKQVYLPVSEQALVPVSEQESVPVSEPESVQSNHETISVKEEPQESLQFVIKDEPIEEAEYPPEENVIQDYNPEFYIKEEKEEIDEYEDDIIKLDINDYVTVKQEYDESTELPEESQNEEPVDTTQSIPVIIKQESNHIPEIIIGSKYTEIIGLKEKKMYTCRKCGFEAIHKEYRKHIETVCKKVIKKRIHHDLSCTDCSEGFQCTELTGAKEIKLYTCNKCGFKASHKVYKVHIEMNCKKTIMKTQSYSCTKCNKAFATMKKYLAHFVNHGFKWLSCPECLKQYFDFNDLISHVRRHIKENFLRVKSITFEGTQLKPDYQCRKCSEIVEVDEYFDHWELHVSIKAENSIENNPTTPHQMDEAVMEDVIKESIECLKERTKTCNQCHRKFNRLNECKRHIIEHLLTDAYSKKHITGKLNCQICGTGCPTAEKYKYHMRDHASLPVYKCELCDHSFSDSSNFTKHKKVHNLKVYVCDLCGKKFQLKLTLIKHLEMHKTTKPITCKLCDKTFFFENIYRKHVRIRHEKRNGYRCVICNERFHSLRFKWDHMWEVHKERKHKADCPICFKSFRKYSDARAHAKLEHKAEVSTNSVKHASYHNTVANIEEMLRKNNDFKLGEMETLVVFE